MIRTIISGGQTGADRAALDTAISLGIAHRGWVPLGRKAEDGTIPPAYRLREMPTASYQARTEQNVFDSDGTVVLSHGPLTKGSALTEKLALRHGRPVLHLDMTALGRADAAEKIAAWVTANGVRDLNVAGPRASHDPAIYDVTCAVLELAIRFMRENDTIHLSGR